MGGSVGVADLLQCVPMLDGLAVSVHLIDVNAGNPTVLRVVVEQIDEVYLCPDVISGDNDSM